MTPPWLHQQAILYHQPTDTLFEVNRLRQQHGTKLYFVSATAAPEALHHETDAAWEGYALNDCSPAQLDHFQAPCWVKQANQQVYVPDARGVEAKGDETSGWLVLEPVYLAAYALAAFFGGTVIDLSTPPAASKN